MGQQSKTTARLVLGFIVLLMLGFSLAIYQGYAELRSEGSLFHQLSAATQWAMDAYPFLWAFVPVILIAPGLTIRSMLTLKAAENQPS